MKAIVIFRGDEMLYLSFGSPPEHSGQPKINKFPPGNPDSITQCLSAYGGGPSGGGGGGGGGGGSR